ncbi:MAG: protein kinase [Sorangiineae bacterium]|nr:protein kinase [Polyangiaceae bacterium]MEB2321753.1 protein kinase [Sorangiineae bacterium]
MADDPSLVGRVLAGRYRLEHQLGGGGMGSIWRAEHLVLCAPVAVKLLDPEIANDDDAIARFNREAQAAAALRSPHVVQILDYGVDEGAPFMVMELLEGESLATRLKRVGRLSPAETSRIITHVARAVGRAHDAGVVHRDLKPENVFLVRNEDAEIAKVLDFGVAKIDAGKMDGSNMTRTGSLLGTPFYMSPEQAQGNKEVDHRSDLWALGVIAYECLTGARPFDSTALGDLVLAICIRDIPVPSEVAVVPPGFDAWWRRAVARDPALRFQSARELSDALRDALGGDARDAIDTLSEVAPSLVAPAEDARPAKPDAPTVVAETLERATAAPARSRPPTSRGKVWLVAAGALVVGLAGGLLVLTELEPQEQRAGLPSTDAGVEASRHAGSGRSAPDPTPGRRATPSAAGAASAGAPPRDAGARDAELRDAASSDAARSDAAAGAARVDASAASGPADAAPEPASLPPPLPIPMGEPSASP